MERTKSPTPANQEPEMINPDVLKIAAMKAILEAIEDGDEKDAKQAVEIIRTILGDK